MNETASAVESFRASYPPGISPACGFNSEDRLLFDEHGAEAVASPSPDSDQQCEIPGRWQFRLTMKPTPHVAWKLEADEFHTMLAGPDTGAVLSYRPPFGPNIDLMKAARNWRMGDATEISGTLPAYELADDALVRDVRFEVVNWGDVIGAQATRYPDPLRMHRNRNEWMSAGWRVTLDGDPDLHQSWKSAKQERGFAVTHSGRLRHPDEKLFSFRESFEVLRCLHFFLSFVRGRRVGIALATGFAHDPGPTPLIEPIIEHWGVTQVDEATSAQSWYTIGLESELERLFHNFHARWPDEARSRELRMMVSAYCVAHNESIPIEMRILAGYIGLETQRRKNLNQPKLESVLTENNLPHRIKDTIDQPWVEFGGPESLVDVRNRIVHHKADYPGTDELWRAWKTCCYYLELLILRKLDYNGQFSDRFQAGWAGTTHDLPARAADATTRSIKPS